MSGHARVGEPVDLAVVGGAPLPHAARDHVRNLGDRTPGGVDLPDPTAGTDRLPEHRVERFRDVVSLSVRPGTPTRGTQSTGELFGLAAQNENVAKREEVGKVTDHEVVREARPATTDCLL
jgi:hypothetical protein